MMQCEWKVVYIFSEILEYGKNIIAKLKLLSDNAMPKTGPKGNPQIVIIFLPN